MPSADHTVTIDRPIEQVFDFFADGTNNPKWRPGVIEISAKGSGPPGVDTEYAQKVKGPRNKPVAADYRISKFQRPSLLEFEVTAGPVLPHGAFDFTPSGSKTMVHFTLDIKPKGLMKLMSRMIGKTAQAEVACLERAKTLLEASS